MKKSKKKKNLMNYKIDKQKSMMQMIFLQLKMKLLQIYLIKQNKNKYSIKSN